MKPGSSKRAWSESEDEGLNGKDDGGASDLAASPVTRTPVGQRPDGQEGAPSQAHLALTVPSTQHLSHAVRPAVPPRPASATLGEALLSSSFNAAGTALPKAYVKDCGICHDSSAKVKWFKMVPALIDEKEFLVPCEDLCLLCGTAL